RADSVEPNVGEKNDPCALLYALPAEMSARASARRNERMPVSGIHGVSRADDEEQYDCHFYKNNDVVDVRRLANTNYQQQRNDRDNDDRWQIEDGGDLRSIRQSYERPARGR